MRWHNGRSRRSRTCNPDQPSKAALLNSTRAQRIPFTPGSCYSNEGRIHSRRPFLSPSFFACKMAADHAFRISDESAQNPACDCKNIVDEGCGTRAAAEMRVRQICYG